MLLPVPGHLPVNPTVTQDGLSYVTNSNTHRDKAYNLPLVPTIMLLPVPGHLPVNPTVTQDGLSYVTNSKTHRDKAYNLPLTNDNVASSSRSPPRESYRDSRWTQLRNQQQHLQG